MNNLILATDSYKFSHWLQYPKNTSYMFSYLESRGGKYPSTVFFGLQYLLKEYLSKPITVEMVNEAKEFAQAHGEPFNYEGWMYIATNLKGKLPIRIGAVAEGTVVPTNNVLMTVESTDDRCFWVVSWFETMLLQVWYPITVATQSYSIKKLIYSYLERTADNPDAEINFKLHDFGYRGVSSQESAGIGGAAHLVNFMGSDTVAGVLCANRYYNTPMSGFSIPAAEHSTMTMWGGRSGEASAMENMVDSYAKPGALFACVSDSYDIYHAVDVIWGEKLRDKVINSGATLVIRPDSGDPVEVLSKLCKSVEEKFGYSYNTKGYKVFNYVRFIWGDGINEESIRRILNVMTEQGYSTTNFAFGMGGALLQQVNRDTQKFAFKCSYAIVDGQGVEVFKDPVTDSGKRSKRGKVDLFYKLGKFVTESNTSDIGSLLHTVYENGEVKKEYSFDEVRKNVGKF